MSGSGAREGFGSPPWNPADRPGVGETRPIPGLSDPSVGDRRENGSAASQNGSAGTSGNGAHGADTSVDLPALPRDDHDQHDDGARDGAAPGTDGSAGAGPDGDGPDGTGRPSGRPRTGKKRSKGRSFWKELPVLIVVALVLALVIKTYAIQAFFIPSGSMQNTLAIGDRILINKIVYHVRGIARGDIVVFNGDGSWDVGRPKTTPNLFTRFLTDLRDIAGASADDDVYVKRVIGLPGDHVACCNAQGKITVDGAPLTEGSYLYPGNAPSTTPFKVTVPAGHVWVMGDHRAISYDSRGHMGDPGGGAIPESAVMGRAFVRIWPPSRWGFLNIPATFEQPKLKSAAAAAGVSSPALAAAVDNGTPLQAAGTALPLGLGIAGAVPLTLLQRSLRRRLSRRRARRR